MRQSAITFRKTFLFPESIKEQFRYNTLYVITSEGMQDLLVNTLSYVDFLTWVIFRLTRLGEDNVIETQRGNEVITL